MLYICVICRHLLSASFLQKFYKDKPIFVWKHYKLGNQLKKFSERRQKRKRIKSVFFCIFFGSSNKTIKNLSFFFIFFFYINRFKFWITSETIWLNKNVGSHPYSSVTKVLKQPTLIMLKAKFYIYHFVKTIIINNFLTANFFAFVCS